MFVQRLLFSLVAAAPLIVMASGSLAGNTDRPPVVEALEDQGLIIKKEFDVDVRNDLSIGDT